MRSSSTKDWVNILLQTLRCGHFTGREFLIVRCHVKGVVMFIDVSEILHQFVTDEILKT